MIELPFSPVLGLMRLGAAELIAIIPVFVLIAGCVVAVAALYFRHQQKLLWHETVRLALEKGQPIPSMKADEPKTPAPQSPANDARSGLILVATGAGLYFFLGFGVAAIVGFIGLALLLYAGCAAIFRSKNPPPRS